MEGDALLDDRVIGEKRFPSTYTPASPPLRPVQLDPPGVSAAVPVYGFRPAVESARWGASAKMSRVAGAKRGKEPSEAFASRDRTLDFQTRSLSLSLPALPVSDTNLILCGTVMGGWKGRKNINLKIMHRNWYMRLELEKYFWKFFPTSRSGCFDVYFYIRSLRDNISCSF